MQDTRAAPLIGISNHDPILLRLLGDTLSERGYRSLVLPQGSTAYDVIKKEKPDLIILDVSAGSPEESWVLFQVLRLDEDTISIPVLIASSDPTQFEKTALGLEHHSGVEVIDKPYDKQTIWDGVASLMAS